MDISKCYKSEPFFKKSIDSTSLHLTLIIGTSTTKIQSRHYHEMGRHQATVYGCGIYSVPKEAIWVQVRIEIQGTQWSPTCVLAWCCDLQEKEGHFFLFCIKLPYELAMAI